MVSCYVLVPGLLGIAVLLIVIFDAFFEPSLAYRIADPKALPLDSDEFVRIVGVLSDAEAHRDTRVEVLTNGPDFLGVLSADDPKGKTFTLEMAILDYDLEDL